MPTAPRSNAPGEITRPAETTFLFLQGLASPFFANLGRALSDRGHAVRRINLSAGDWLFWRLPSDHYRGSRHKWPTFIAQYLARHAVTDIVLFGDCRPYHRAAIEAARPLGLRIHVFEEGYVRPNWITVELGGVNGYSALPRDPQAIRERARRLPQPGRAQPQVGDMLRRSIWDVAYTIANVGFPYLYPGFRSHRPVHVLAEYAGWIGRFLRRGRTRRHAAAVSGETVAHAGGFYLVPLQLDSDFQMRVHSTFAGVEAFMERTIASFAAHADGATKLLVKLHPLDSGLVDWAGKGAAIAARHGVADRVGFIDGGDLPHLIEACRGVVLVNSTVGMYALECGRATIALGQAIYDLPGLTHQGDLDGFWAAPQPPEEAMVADFRRVVLHSTQVNGGFFSRVAIDRAVEGAVMRLEATVPMRLPAAAPVPEGLLAAA